MSLQFSWISFCNNKENSLKDPHALALGFVFLLWSSTWKSSISYFFCGCCDRGDVAMSVPLGLLKWWLSIALSHSLFPFFSLHFFSPSSVLLMLVFKCVCLCSYTWMLSRTDKKKKHALVAGAETKSILWWGVMQTSKWLVGLLYFSSGDTSNGPDHTCANMKNRLFASSHFLSASGRLCCWCSLLKMEKSYRCRSFLIISCISYTSLIV